MDEQELNLEEMLKDVTPSMVTPKLGEIMAANSKARPKQIAHLIIRGMANSLKNPVKKEIIHNGEIHTVHYIDVEPLCTGSWAIISLLLLHLSYGEQSTIIEALYPASLQLCAKSFAVIFTTEIKDRPVLIKQDEALLNGIENANAGIAMILSLLKNVGTIPHADEINKNKQTMAQLVTSMQERDRYHKQYTQSQDAAKHQDGLTR